MSNKVAVYKNRDNTILVDFQEDVSADTFTSEIRSEPKAEGALITEWTVSFLTDGTDGIVVLYLDALTTSQVEAYEGYMDMKRVTGGNPVPAWDDPLKVEFQGTVTQ